jgi:hypothetical protein
MSEAEALRLLLKVKPDADMPRPGAHNRTSIMAGINDDFGPVGAPGKFGRAGGNGAKLRPGERIGSGAGAARGVE